MEDFCVLSLSRMGEQHNTDAGVTSVWIIKYRLSTPTSRGDNSGSVFDVWVYPESGRARTAHSLSFSSLPPPYSTPFLLHTHRTPPGKKQTHFDTNTHTHNEQATGNTAASRLPRRVYVAARRPDVHTPGAPRPPRPTRCTCSRIPGRRAGTSTRRRRQGAAVSREAPRLTWWTWRTNSTTKRIVCMSTTWG